MNEYKIGFACKYKSGSSSIKTIKEEESFFNTKTTTAKWLNNQSVDIAEERLFSIINYNLESLNRINKYIKTLPKELQMFRISSDILPFYTHKKWKYFYQKKEIQELLISRFADIGRSFRNNNIRVSMHPGQFCVLASENPNVVENSIEELEYHMDMIRMMGYGERFQDFKCNIHISGKKGVEGILSIKERLSSTAHNCLTFENEEWTYGLYDCLLLSKYFPIVLDVHHFWIKEEYYIDIKSEDVSRVIDSWRGVRPTMHYSQSHENILPYLNNTDSFLDIKLLLENKEISKRKLSAHSEMMWNDYTNQYILNFLDYFDIMFEAKHKNLSTIEFYNKYLKK